MFYIILVRTTPEVDQVMSMRRANVQVRCMYSLMSAKSTIYSYMVLKLDQIFTFALSLVETNSLMRCKIWRREGQIIRQFQANLQIEPLSGTANYELRVYYNFGMPIIFCMYLYTITQTYTQKCLVIVRHAQWV